MSDSTRYEVYALRYGTRPTTKSDQYFRYDLYGEPDAPQVMDYFFWLVRNREWTILVDCGFHLERGGARGRRHETDPFELLHRMGVSAADVDHVVISHMHFDHVGNIDAFPNATFTIADSEYRFWTGAHGQTELTRTIVDAQDLRTLQRLDADGRLMLINEPTRLFPEIDVTPIGGHSPGQMITMVGADPLRVVLASDAAHYQEAFQRRRPIKLFHDLGAVYAAYDLLQSLETESATVVVTGHEPRVREWFASAEENCIDLTAPRDGDRVTKASAFTGPTS